MSLVDDAPCDENSYLISRGGSASFPQFFASVVLR
jgi:hypothetical protein